MNKKLVLTAFAVILLWASFTGCAEPKVTGPANQPTAKTPPKTAPPAEAEPAPPPAKGKRTVTFKGGDQLEITGDLYIEHEPGAPFILLFHQARWSRGEYLEIAPKLNKLGFNLLALDQRSGGEVNSVTNETHRRAVKAGLGTTYLDAYADLQAALHYVKKELAKGNIIVWGSSYSASLVFRIAAEHQELVTGLLAFAPGEYFAKLNGDKAYIKGFAPQVKCPVFVTSAKREEPQWRPIYEALTAPKTEYLPTTEGNHGSRALWEKFADHTGYWTAVTTFLNQFVSQ